VLVATAKTTWRIRGQEVGSCNCDWGCPCQFNAPPTTGHCEGLAAYEIQEGQYGDTSLDGVRFAGIFYWPGRIDEGNGTQMAIVDEAATAEQRAAIEALVSGTEGGTFFEIFAAVAPNRVDTVSAPIEIECDRKRRVASVRIPGIAAARIEPIKNPVTGEEHQARIVLPNGFEFTEAEMANTVECNTTAPGPLSLTLTNSYAQLNDFSWSNT
jgi:hypothetical protein